ncbi:minor capsid protein [Paenibacillus lentus]|uniref:minor capsid protein n=1 Tax=Paenibacillus lentus TaxID=1338368 RepID=UPI003667A65B
MSTKAELYWLRRALANSSKAFNTAEIQLLLLKRQYEKSKRKLRRDIDEFYKELGEDVSPAAANQELKDRSGITRKEKLLQQIEDELDQLTTAEEELLQKTLGGTYRGAYYRSIYKVQHKLGIGVDFALLPTRAVEQAVKTAWSGDNYSTLIWKRRKKLAKAAGEIVQDGVNLGESNDQMASKLAEIMDSSYSRAKRLIRTETAYVYNAASMKGYEEAGIERYQFLATLDMRTSKPCQRLDNQVFYLKDAQVSVNMPPIHPNCRSTTIPYFDDNELRERIARGLDGKTYKVPANMDYATWYKEHVEGKHPESEITAAQKKIRNKSQDRKQYEKVKETLGKGSPKTFAAFQQLKYNEVEKWQQTKRKVRQLKNK